MKRLFLILIILAVAVANGAAQKRKVQNRPYVDLRPMHFGISIGMNMQDVKMKNVGPQLVSLPDVGDTERTVYCDADTWNPGFSVGVVGDLRLNQYLSLRVTPSMHFGSKRLVFRDMDNLSENGTPRETTQDMKNTSVSVPVDVKFAAERFNNYRPYMLAGVSPMLNLSGKDQDYMHLKPFDMMVEVGMGCDLYLPFFKLIPELKFCYGLTNAYDKSHANELRDVNQRVFSNAVQSARSSMFVFTLYFE
ncbi:MAG: PorT family protein [Prevotella sp.]|nr:PorT family protein [Prevotella sp.]